MAFNGYVFSLPNSGPGGGLFVQNGGTNTISGTANLSIGTNAGSAGEYDLIGGSLSVGGSVYVGGSPTSAGGEGALSD